jgi:AraC family transcriptional regulator, regulatory protein of adaptative response / methylated-DNA-[protein]-cysteine methyltransferase
MSAKSVPAADPLDRVLNLIISADAPLPLGELARSVGLSASHLQRTFRKRFGVSPAEYAQSRRLRSLKSALRQAPRVTDAIYDAGYGSGSRVYEKTGQLLGMTPASYRRGGAGVALRYTTLKIPVGFVLVAATERGTCAVTLGNGEAKLVADLRGEFPHASISRVDAGRDEWLKAVIARVSAEFGARRASASSPLPPVDIHATAFQWRVWHALQRIPHGVRRSYAEIAVAIGAPRSTRAVANACGRNRLAIIVPCHRVVRSDGSLGGYRWGIARKRALLTREAAK